MGMCMIRERYRTGNGWDCTIRLRTVWEGVSFGSARVCRFNESHVDFSLWFKRLGVHGADRRSGLDLLWLSVLAYSHQY